MTSYRFLEEGARCGTARQPDGHRPSLAAPLPSHRRVLRRIRQQSGQPIFSRSAFASSTRQKQEVRCYARPEQLDGLRSSDVSSLAERIFEESYKIGELLGIGSFGKVYRATHRAGSGPDYAVKIVSKHREGSQDERVARRIHEEVRQLLVHVVHLRKMLCKVYDRPFRAIC
jgi:serine/threonine protein kinase